MVRKKKLTHEAKVNALTPPSKGFLKDTPSKRIQPKSPFLLALEAKQVQEIEILLPSNVAKIRR